MNLKLIGMWSNFTPWLRVLSTGTKTVWGIVATPFQRTRFKTTLEEDTGPGEHPLLCCKSRTMGGGTWLKQWFKTRGLLVRGFPTDLREGDSKPQHHFYFLAWAFNGGGVSGFCL